MPYKKGYKKRYYKRNSYNNTKKIVQSVLAKTIEVKTDVTPLAIDISTASVGYNPLDYLGQGLTDSTRIGNRVNLLSLSLRSALVSADDTNFVRIAFVETRKQLPLLTSSYYDTSSVWKSPSLGINSGFNYDVVQRVHFNKLFNMQQVISGVDRQYVFNKNVNFKKGGKQCLYSGDLTTTLGEVTQTTMYLVLLSDSTIAFHPTFNGQFTIRFTDG